MLTTANSLHLLAEISTNIQAYFFYINKLVLYAHFYTLFFTYCIVTFYIHLFRSASFSYSMLDVP